MIDMDLNAGGRMETLQPAAVTIENRGLGTRILEVDIAEELDDATFAAIERAYNENSVIVIPGQKCTPEQQIRFSRRFGPLSSNVLTQFLLPDHPEIIVVSNIVENGTPLGQAAAGHHCHTDASYLAKPA